MFFALVLFYFLSKLLSTLAWILFHPKTSPFRSPLPSFPPLRSKQNIWASFMDRSPQIPPTDSESVATDSGICGERSIKDVQIFLKGIFNHNLKLYPKLSLNKYFTMPHLHICVETCNLDDSIESLNNIWLPT